MSDTTDPGAALPSRVREYLRDYKQFNDGPNEPRSYALIRDLASALQQTQAENAALKEAAGAWYELGQFIDAAAIGYNTPQIVAVMVENRVLRAKLAAAEAALQQTQAENERLAARASRLEDAAFHFQTCRMCRTVGEDSCGSGERFAAFLRGEPDEN